MSELHLVTGYKNTAHITSADQGVFNAMTTGVGEYVLTKGERFKATITGSNTVRIYDGSLVMNGRHVNLDSGAWIDVPISNGSSGLLRNDIIVVRYEMNTASGIESARLAVVEGIPKRLPLDPTIQYSGSILDGAVIHDMPLYRVVLNGFTLEKVEPLFQVLAPMADFQHGFYKQNLLINGDFQCNQRSQKTYNADGAVRYTLDMWRAYKVTVEALNEGIKLTGTSATEQGYLTQFIQLGLLKTTTYTISAMVNGKVCTFTVTPGAEAKEKNFGTFKISALTVSVYDNDLPDFNYYDNKLKINICPVGTNAITVKYVDVFEGSVAYPHVKEDPATAMMRCRRYIQVGTCFSPFLEELTANTYGKQLRFGIPVENMTGDPILEVLTAFCSGVQTYQGNGVNKDKVTTYLKTATEWQFDTNEVTAIANGHYYGFRVRYRITSEFHPTGD